VIAGGDEINRIEDRGRTLAKAARERRR